MTSKKAELLYQLFLLAAELAEGMDKKLTKILRLLEHDKRT